jgi:menaquinone-dependent protoporphyrinogen oxidase
MSVLVAYASKHGATRGIAERVGDTLRSCGLETDVQSIKDVADITQYAAFVIGGAVYFGSWLKEVVAFLERHQATLAEHPVWLFSSGPLASAPTQGTGPKQLEQVAKAIQPRDHHVFFGALDHRTFDLPERLLWSLPASRKLLVEGDFRDWPDVETWAVGIAVQLEDESISGVQTGISHGLPTTGST